ncbi:MAG: hypothetical protein JWO83_944 [Caulobacteraceae bacterium]|nr:hypothetical protein [Caulobacteraceae bacterium]
MSVSMLSYSDIFSISHDREYDEDVQPGHLVRTGPNLFPHFEVIAVHGDKAWVRNVVTGVDALTPLSRCRRLAEPALAVAAE